MSAWSSCWRALTLPSVSSHLLTPVHPFLFFVRVLRADTVVCILSFIDACVSFLSACFDARVSFIVSLLLFFLQPMSHFFLLRRICNPFSITPSAIRHASEEESSCCTKQIKTTNNGDCKQNTQHKVKRWNFCKCKVYYVTVVHTNSKFGY